jgi:hypothetical protein
MVDELLPDDSSNDETQEKVKKEITSNLSLYDSDWKKVTEIMNIKKQIINNRDYIRNNQVLDLVIRVVENKNGYNVNGSKPAKISILLEIQELYKILTTNYKTKLLKLIQLFIDELSPTNESMKVIKEFLDKCSISHYSWLYNQPTTTINNINDLLNYGKQPNDSKRVNVNIVKPKIQIKYDGLYSIKRSEIAHAGALQDITYTRWYYPWCKRDYAAAALNVGTSTTKVLAKGTAGVATVAGVVGVGTVAAVGLGTAYVGEKAYHRYVDAKARLNGEKNSMGGSTHKTHRTNCNRTRKYKRVHKVTRNNVKRHANNRNKQNTRKARKH